MSKNQPQGYHKSAFWTLYDKAAELVDRKVGWHRLPVPLGLAVLIGIRDVLRKRNLYDTSALPAVNPPPVPPATPQTRTTRNLDGTYNDLSQPRMGMAGSRFGRNVPLGRTEPEPLPQMMQPSPREVSRALFTRTELIPATSVNALVAAWLQFMIHDWFSHGKGPKENPWEIPLTDDDPWPVPPMPDDPAVDPRIVPGFWLGLLMLQTLFTLEHNSICDRLRAEYPHWSDDEIYQRARLINVALIAKIHTVEWTPAVISHPTTKVGMRANWWGLAGERVHRVFGRISKSEVISGIPGSATDHYGVPYSLTEEFVAVYRMHPLVPDDYDLRSSADDRGLMQATLRDLAGPGAVTVAQKVGMTDLMYSFGTQHPGLVTLHNFPRFLQEFYRPDGSLQDLAATDILRSRELGVPRYNEFRRLLQMRPAKDFDDLTDSPEWARQIEKVYGGDIERVDLTVGMEAERRPAGFAFSDTAFRIFLLMAARRLNSDRFFTTDYTPAVYTQAGLDWINDNTMTSVLLRHYPQLRPALGRVPNAFTPWVRVAR